MKVTTMTQEYCSPRDGKKNREGGGGGGHVQMHKEASFPSWLMLC